jgi:hypothetical protein
MLIIFALIFSISSIIISYKMREDYDPLLLIKLIGLFLLSVVTISFNTLIPIPIGFVAAYLISMRSQYNKKGKKVVTLLGFLTTVLCIILYYIQ